MRILLSAGLSFEAIVYEWCFGIARRVVGLGAVGLDKWWRTEFQKGWRTEHQKLDQDND